MPEASGKPGTRFHGYILNVVFWDGEQSQEDLEKEHFWFAMLHLGPEPERLKGKWIGRLPLDWTPYTWTPEEFEQEMELSTWQP